MKTEVNLKRKRLEQLEQNTQGSCGTAQKGFSLCRWGSSNVRKTGERGLPPSEAESSGWRREEGGETGQEEDIGLGLQGRHVSKWASLRLTSCMRIVLRIEPLFSGLHTDHPQGNTEVSRYKMATQQTLLALKEGTVRNCFEWPNYVDAGRFQERRDYREISGQDCCPLSYGKCQ